MFVVTCHLYTRHVQQVSTDSTVQICMFKLVVGLKAEAELDLLTINVPKKSSTNHHAFNFPCELVVPAAFVAIIYSHIVTLKCILKTTYFTPVQKFIFHMLESLSLFLNKPCIMIGDISLHQLRAAQSWDSGARAPGVRKCSVQNNLQKC